MSFKLYLGSIQVSSNKDYFQYFLQGELILQCVKHSRLLRMLKTGFICDVKTYRAVGRSKNLGGISSNGMGIICHPLIEIWLTYLSKYGGRASPPCPPPLPGSDGPAICNLISQTIQCKIYMHQISRLQKSIISQKNTEVYLFLTLINFDIFEKISLETCVFF